MKLLGGRAHIKGITFQSTTHIVTAKREKEGNIVIKIRKITVFNNRLNRFILKLPFLRGLYVVINNLLRAKKMLLILVVISLIIEFFSWYLIINELVFLSQLEIYMLMAFLCLLIMLIKATNMGKYHGAEHKTFNAFQKERKINVENVKAESRITARCGTNFLIFVVFIALLLELQPFLELSSWSLLIGILVGYEIFKSKNPWINKIVFPLYKLGGAAQYYLFTSEPTIKELEVAIQAVKVLENG